MWGEYKTAKGGGGGQSNTGEAFASVGFSTQDPSIPLRQKIHEILDNFSADCRESDKIWQGREAYDILYGEMSNNLTFLIALYYTGESVGVVS